MLADIPKSHYGFMVSGRGLRPASYALSSPAHTLFRLTDPVSIGRQADEPDPDGSLTPSMSTRLC